MDTFSFQVNDATIDLSWARHAKVNLTETLDVQANGASSLQHVWEPTLGSINSSGGYTVNKK